MALRRLKPGCVLADNQVMADLEHQEEHPRPYRPLPEDQITGAQAAFLLAHPACGEDVELWRGEWSLVCWCERCSDLRTYQLVEADPEP